MPFIPTTENKNYSLAVEMSRQLHKAIADRIKKTQFLPKDWAKEFCMLLKTHEIKDVQKTLDWFCANVGKEFVPVCTTARYFKLKYDQIVQAMLRAEVATECSPENSAFVKRLEQQYQWPPEVRGKLEHLVIKSHEGVELLRKSIGELRKGELTWLTYINTVIGPRLHLFMELWFEDLAARLNYPYKQHYNGDINHLVFDFRSERFRTSYWHEWSNVWCGRPTGYDDLLDALIEVSKRG